MNPVNYPIQLIGTVYDQYSVPYVQQCLISSNIEHTFMKSAPIFIAQVKSIEEYETVLSCPSLIQVEFDTKTKFI